MAVYAKRVWIGTAGGAALVRIWERRKLTVDRWDGCISGRPIASPSMTLLVGIARNRRRPSQRPGENYSGFRRSAMGKLIRRACLVLMSCWRCQCLPPGIRNGPKRRSCASNCRRLSKPRALGALRLKLAEVEYSVLRYAPDAALPANA